jgi:hypothetical protein
VAGKEIAVKKYVVRLDTEERDRLDELIRKGKRSAQLLTKARILLRADVSDAGEGWSDSRISASTDQSAAAENVPSCNEMGIDFGMRGSLNTAREWKTAKVSRPFLSASMKPMMHPPRARKSLAFSSASDF